MVTQIGLPFPSPPLPSPLVISAVLHAPSANQGTISLAKGGICVSLVTKESIASECWVRGDKVHTVGAFTMSGIFCLNAGRVDVLVT